MKSKTVDGVFKTSVEAFEHARHRARYAHYESVVYSDSKGVWFAERYSRQAIKNAMLACGTKRHFNVVGSGSGTLVRWAEACIRLRNVKYLLAA